MAGLKVFLMLCFVGVAFSGLVDPSVDGKADSDEFDDDPLGYLAEQASSFFDEILKEDKVKVSDDVEINRNDNNDDEDITARSDNSYGDKIIKYMKTHDVTLQTPVGAIKVGARNLDNQELDINLNFGGEKEVTEARKHKLKKIVSPLLVFFLLKAITLVPLTIGFLLLKAWNALQLSVFSFIISAGLAIFQLCKKIAENNAAAHIAAHGPWEPTAHHVAARSYDEKNSQNNDAAQKMAYSAYVR